MLEKYKIHPLKGLGQNFLVNKGAVKRVINAADIKPDEVILEVGPGLGALTEELAKKAKKVIAVEKDRKMVEILKETLKGFENIEIVQGDILKLRLKIPKPYKIVANLPFHLTAPVVRKFLETAKKNPQHMILVVQKEVGQRICSKVPDMNLLAVSVQFYAEAKIIDYIPRKSFWPRPKVDAAIIKIQITKSKLQNFAKFGLAKEKTNLFFKVAKAGFSQPRKQLINNLSQGLKLNRVKVEGWLKKNGIHSTQRAETLTLKDWIKLTKSIKI